MSLAGRARRLRYKRLFAAILLVFGLPWLCFKFAAAPVAKLPSLEARSKDATAKLDAASSGMAASRAQVEHQPVRSGHSSGTVTGQRNNERPRAAAAQKPSPNRAAPDSTAWGYWADKFNGTHAERFEHAKAERKEAAAKRADMPQQDLSHFSTLRKPDPNSAYPFGFAACLLTKDDKILLPEWLAYHYTVLPLRYLVAGIDPHSTTDPEGILNEFSASTDMELEIWRGNFYWRDGKFSDDKFENQQTARAQAKFPIHRQLMFYTACLRRLGRLGFSWVVAIDSDEYFTYNPMNIFPTILESAHNKRRASSIELDRDKRMDSIELRSQVPRTIGLQNETIAHWIAKNQVDGRINGHYCIIYPRVAFSPMYVHNDTSYMPDGFDAQSFHSLQYARAYQRPNRLGKALINVNEMDPARRVVSAHWLVSRKQCVGTLGTSLVFDYKAKQWIDKTHEALDNAPFRVHHYSGSLQIWLSRPERTEEQWVYRNKIYPGLTLDTDDLSLVTWLKEFTKLVGREKAHRLTVVTREAAYQEALEMKHRAEKFNETARPLYEWDFPDESKLEALGISEDQVHRWAVAYFRDCAGNCKTKMLHGRDQGKGDRSILRRVKGSRSILPSVPRDELRATSNHDRPSPPLKLKPPVRKIPPSVPQDRFRELKMRNQREGRPLTRLQPSGQRIAYVPSPRDRPNV